MSVYIKTFGGFSVGDIVRIKSKQEIEQLYPGYIAREIYQFCDKECIINFIRIDEGFDRHKMAIFDIEEIASKINSVWEWSGSCIGDYVWYAKDLHLVKPVVHTFGSLNVRFYNGDGFYANCSDIPLTTMVEVYSHE